MALKKSQLYSSLWQSCDQLRGGMDASQYKDYVLTLLFMKYVSDKHAGNPDALIEVPEGGSFADMVKLKGDKEIGDKINKIISELAESQRTQGGYRSGRLQRREQAGPGQGDAGPALQAGGHIRQSRLSRQPCRRATICWATPTST